MTRSSMAVLALAVRAATASAEPTTRIDPAGPAQPGAAKNVRALQPAGKSVRLEQIAGSASLHLAEYSGVPVELGALCGASSIEAAELVSAQKEDRLLYVVVRLSGPTTTGGGMGPCGAGEEENLVWLKLSGPQILDVQSVRVGSCAFNVEAQPLGSTKQGLRLEYWSYSDKRKFVLTYDRRAPEQGFSIRSESLPD